MTPSTMWQSPQADPRRIAAALLAAALLLTALLPTLAPPPRPELAALTPQQAVSIATSGIPAARGPFERMGLASVEYTPEGVRYQPRLGGPALSWQLDAVRAGATAAAGVDAGPVSPGSAAGAVEYGRGALTERYVELGGGALEQQLVIAAPLALGGGDLEIVGRVGSSVAPAAAEGGWVWRTDKGAVALGALRATDAAGAALPARLEVRGGTALMVVGGAALAAASYPVTLAATISPELTITSVSGSGALDAFEPAVAFSPATNSYLVVFSTDLRRDTEYEIYGQFIDAADGARKGEPFKISQIGDDSAIDGWDAFSPDVAYAPPGSFSNQNGTTSWQGGFLVTWSADNSNPVTGGYYAAGAFEIYAQLVGEGGQLLLADDLAMSEIDVGRWPTAEVPRPDWDAFTPAVEYDPLAGEFLVCWSSDRDDVNTLVTNGGGAFEIYCKLFRLAPGPGRAYLGAVPEGKAVQISATGPVRSPATEATYTLFDAYTPDIAYKPFVANGAGTADDEPRGFYVVWSADNNRVADEQEGEFEIFGQFVVSTATTLQEYNVSPFRDDGRVSRVGEDAGCAADGCDAYYPAVTYNPDRAHFLVAYTGDNVNGEEEVFVSLRSSDGLGMSRGIRLQQISQMGGPNSSALDGFEPAVAYDAGLRQYMVTWRGDNAVDESYEIFHTRLDATTPSDAELDNSASDVPISVVGGSNLKVGTSGTVQRTFFSRQLGGNYATSVETDLPFSNFHNAGPAVATTGKGDHLIVWAAETGAAGAEQIDIRGQLFQLNDAPSVTVPADIVTAPTGESGAVVSFAAPTASDPEDGPLTPVCVSAPTAGLASGSTFPFGITTITCTATDSVGKSASASFTVEVSVPDTWANLGLSLSIAPNPVRAGGTVSATFTIANNGPADATEVVLTTSTPSGATFAAGAAGCAAEGGQVRCPVGTVASGATATVTVAFTLSPTASGPRSLSASVAGAETDPSTSNNGSSGSFAVEPEPGTSDFLLYLPLLRQ